MVENSTKRARLKKSIFTASMFILVIVSVNYFSAIWFTRFDFTSEKRFTLSPATRAILASLDKPITIKVYLDGEMPAAFKKLKTAGAEMLDEFAAYSHGNLTVEFINPVGSDDAHKNDVMVDELVKKGLQPLNLQMKTAKGTTQKLVFPVALVTAAGRSLPVSLMQNQNQLAPGIDNEQMMNKSVENLEFIFISAIKKMNQSMPPVIGFLGGNGEYSGAGIADIVQTLQLAYTVHKVLLPLIPLDSLLGMKLLIMVKPQIKFTEPEKYKLDQFLMYGGKLLLLIDNLHAELDSMGAKGSTLGFAENLNLDDMLFRYGIRINYNLIEDLNCAPIPVLSGTTDNSNQQNLYPWKFYPVVMPASVHPVVRNIDPVRLQFAGSIDTLGNAEIKKTVLLSSSADTRLAVAPVYISLADITESPDPKLYQEGRKPVAVLLEGKFKSVFNLRSIDSADKTEPFAGISQNNAIIAVSDGDIIKNELNTLEHSIYPLGYDKYTRQVFGNKQFILNAVDYLAGEQALIRLRSKEVKLRMLDKDKLVTEKSYWQVINTVVPLALVFLTAVLISIYRKRRYGYN